jgi:hypothetical protein
VFSGHSCLNASKDFQVSENSRISIVQKNLGGSQVSLQPGLAAVDEAGKSGKNKPLNKKADKNRSAGKIRIPKPPIKRRTGIMIKISGTGEMRIRGVGCLGLTRANQRPPAPILIRTERSEPLWRESRTLKCASGGVAATW